MPLDNTWKTIPRWKSILNTARFTSQPLAVIGETLKEQGHTYKLYMGGLIPAILTTDAELIQQVLQKQHRKYPKSPYLMGILADYLGWGLLTLEGADWTRQRKLIQPGFYKQQLQLVMEEMVRQIKSYPLPADGKPFDIAHHTTQLTFRVITQAVFSKGLDASEVDFMGKSLITLQHFIIRLIRQPYLTFLRKWTGQIAKHKHLSEEVDAILLKHIRNRKNSTERYDDLLQMLLDARYEDTQEPMTEQQLLDEVKILLTAGHETSANALAWACHLWTSSQELPKNVDANLEGDGTTQFLHETLLEIQKVYTNESQKPVFEWVNQLERLKCLVEETMRLYPPAWVTDRILNEEDSYKGNTIAKGTMIITYFYGVHRDSRYWKHPDHFMPQRFYKQDVPAAYFPFGAGPRKCIGYHFAMFEMMLILGHWLHEYELKAVVDAPAVEPEALITLRPKNGIWIRAQKKARL